METLANGTLLTQMDADFTMMMTSLLEINAALVEPLLRPITIPTVKMMILPKTSTVTLAQHGTIGTQKHADGIMTRTSTHANNAALAEMKLNAMVTPGNPHQPPSHKGSSLKSKIFFLIPTTMAKEASLTGSSTEAQRKMTRLSSKLLLIAFSTHPLATLKKF